MVAAATEAGADGLGTLVQDLAAHFYADGGLIVLDQPERMQRAFNVITDIFICVSLRPNMRKMVNTEFQTCHTPGSMLVVAYERRATGMGPTFQEQQRM